jgi:hypothetical protein
MICTNAATLQKSFTYTASSKGRSVNHKKMILWSETISILAICIPTARNFVRILSGLEKWLKWKMQLKSHLRSGFISRYRNINAGLSGRFCYKICSRALRNFVIDPNLENPNAFTKNENYFKTSATEGMKQLKEILIKKYT